MGYHFSLPRIIARLNAAICASSYQNKAQLLNFRLNVSFSNKAEINAGQKYSPE
jgi:hypothetical protein